MNQRAVIAQAVERHIGNVEATGSSPVNSLTKAGWKYFNLLFYFIINFTYLFGYLLTTKKFNYISIIYFS